VHADATAFPAGATKAEAYKHLIEQMQALMDGQRNWVSQSSLHPLKGLQLTFAGLVCVTSAASTPINLRSNLANASSLLWHLYHSLPSPSPLRGVNWAGFYVLDRTVAHSSTPPSSSSSSTNSKRPQQQLILGPFQGRVACQTILFGRGVCGTAALSQRTQLVPDVEAYPGHIACDGETKSEIVVPILLKGQTLGVIDVDCGEVEGFDEIDARGLGELAKVLAEGCDWRVS
jgi:L-methionine (R)-S-oxide reductase